MNNSMKAMAACAGAAALCIQLPSLAQSQDQDSSVFCSRGTSARVTKYPRTTVPDGYSDLQTYMLDSDFRSPSNSTPWSESKIFDDPVTGQYPAVADRNYIPNASRIHTLWTRDVIIASGVEILSAYSIVRLEFDTMMIRYGDSFLVLRGCDGRFPVDAQVAEALRSTDTSKKVFIKLYAENSGAPVLSEVGPGTVNAWKKIYANWSKSTKAKPQELGF